MLKTLRVTNFALIEHAELEFSPGFNVLSGETGAGKSIIVDSLGIVLGGRASMEGIRSGCDGFRMQAVFEPTPDNPVFFFLAQQGIPVEEDGSLIVSRSFSRQGKNLVTVNGMQVPLAVLRQLGDMLLDMHGQHENQALLRPESYIGLLDGFDAEIIRVLGEYRTIYRSWQETGDQLQQLDKDLRERMQRADMLRWQVEEITAAKLGSGDDAELENQVTLLTHAEKIAASVSAAYGAVAGDEDSGAGAAALLQACKKQLDSASRYDPELKAQSDQLAAILIQIEDLVPTLRNYVEHIEFDPEKLAKLQSRMDLIYKLKKKYGATVAEILKYAESASVELVLLDRHDELKQELTQKQAQLAAQLQELADKLHVLRTTAGGRLQKEVEKHLHDLGMNGAVFAIRVESTPEFGLHGRDRVQFEFSANPGEEMRPLAKVASGGELSRIALAIKTVCARNDGIDVMVFDEIDAGVGGQTARRVAEKIAQVADSKQVLCITHLAQIASLADSHIHIEKRLQGDRTKTFVSVLNEEQRLQELARMMGGEPITETGLKNAAEMLAAAKSGKGRGN